MDPPHNTETEITCTSLVSCRYSATWNFSESDHDKGAADGVGGAMKRMADENVAHGHDIVDASALYSCLKNTSTVTRIFWINTSDIDFMETILATVDIKPIAGTMSLHQLAWGKCSSGTISLRSLSCFDCPPSVPCQHYDAGGLKNMVTKKIMLED